jgi:hypothetical protein
MRLACLPRFLSLTPSDRCDIKTGAVPSSRGLGHRPLTAETRVRFPLGLPKPRLTHRYYGIKNYGTPERFGISFAANNALPSSRVRFGPNRLNFSRVTTGLLCPSRRATQLMFSPHRDGHVAQMWRIWQAAGTAPPSASACAPRFSAGTSPDRSAAAWGPGTQNCPPGS